MAEEVTLTLQAFSSLSPRDKTATVIDKGVVYYTRKQTDKTPHVITHWVVTDLGTKEGKQLVIQALEQMVSLLHIKYKNNTF